ncbi:MAG TPA: Hsp20/alpha crystallin family protein [Ktedonobacteraceae bacterium]|jgi:HSP20 family protein
MAMQPYTPIDELMNWHNLSRFMNETMSLRPHHIGELMSRFSKPLDLYETANGYDIHYPIAGAKPESIEITVRNNTVSISWETGTTPPADARQVWSGIQHGIFQEQFTLPAELDAKSAGADYENGVLYIHVAKASPESAKTIRVSTGKGTTSQSEAGKKGH